MRTKLFSLAVFAVLSGLGGCAEFIARKELSACAAGLAAAKNISTADPVVTTLADPIKVLIVYHDDELRESFENLTGRIAKPDSLVCFIQGKYDWESYNLFVEGMTPVHLMRLDLPGNRNLLTSKSAE